MRQTFRQNVWPSIQQLLFSTAEQDSLKRVNRDNAYLFAMFTGASIAFSFIPSYFGRYEQVIAQYGPVNLVLMFVFVMLSSDDPYRRADRFVRCAIIALVTVSVLSYIAATPKLNLDNTLMLVPIKLIDKIELIDAVAFSFALASNALVFWLIFIRKTKIHFGEIPAFISGILTAVGAAQALVLH